MMMTPQILRKSLSIMIGPKSNTPQHLNDQLTLPKNIFAVDKPRQMKKQKTPKGFTLDQIEMGSDYEGPELDSLSWNEFQEIKNILYATNFKGRESIAMAELHKRKTICYLTV